MTKIDLHGLHWASKRLADGSLRYYYYAWRGGPKILTTDRLLTTATPALVDAFQAAHKAARAPADGFVAGLIQRYQESPEWAALAKRTQADYRRWLDQIHDRFGTMPLEAADDRGVIKHFIAFRNKWAYSPRQADHAVMVLKVLLEWGRAQGLLDHNRAATIGKLYSVDKSENVWTAAQIASACAATITEGGRPRAVAPEVQRAIRLGACIGLRLGDLVALRWDQVHLDHIARPTNKSGGKRVARIPLLPEAREVLDACPRRALTVLTNTRGRPWTPSGLSHAITEAAQAAGVERSTHDLRRTCATRLASAGFTDQEVGDWLGWSAASVSKLRRVYVDQSAVILSAVERIKRNESGQ